MKNLLVDGKHLLKALLLVKELCDVRAYYRDQMTLIHFSAWQGRLVIMVSDGESTLSIRLNGEGEAGFEFTTVSIRNLMKIFDGVSGYIEVTMDDSGVVTFISDSVTYRPDLTTPDSDYDFAAPECLEDSVYEDTYFDASVLSTSIRKVLPAINCDNPDVVLRGVYIDNSADTTIFVATDKDRLHLYESGQSFLACNLVVPVSSASTVVKMLEILKPYRVGLSDYSALETDANPILRVSILQPFEVSLAINCIDSPYPNYQKAMPESFDCVYVVLRQDIIRAMAKISSVDNVMSKKAFALYREDNRMVFECGHPEENEQISQSIDLLYHEGDPHRISFNSTFLLDAIKHVDSDIIRIDLNSTGGPMLMTDENSPLKVLIVPCVRNFERKIESKSIEGGVI